MAYVYESIQGGIVSFTNPSTGKTITLFKGTKVTVDQKLAGGYLRVLRLVGEVPDEKPAVEAKATGNSKAKVADKITKVEEVAEPVVEKVEVAVEDTVAAVAETEVVVEKTEEQVAPVEVPTVPVVEEKPASKKNFKKR